MTKFYIYEQAEQYWNNARSKFVSLPHATVFTEQEFLKQTMGPGTWLEISDKGVKRVEMREEMIDRMVLAMRKWDRERLMNFLADNMDYMISDDLLPTMYSLIIQDAEELQQSPNLFDQYVKYMDGADSEDNTPTHGMSPLDEIQDAIDRINIGPDGIPFPSKGIEGEVRTLSDGKQYQYNAGSWLPVTWSNEHRWQ